MRYGLGITLFALALASMPARAEERIELKVGEQRLLTVGALTRLALGEMEFAEVRTVGTTQVEVTGLAPGSTKLLVWKRSGERVDYTLEVTGEAAKAPGVVSPPEETVTLKKGATRDVHVKGLMRVAVGDPKVADISVSGTDVVRVTASKVGETTLLVWSGDGKERRAYRITVKE
ncbi:pilus assembly protein N-terminal domain-containing protein [Pyxidicoccus trucidator]|uniref:pilus assembly protein N-terminal domain-containing protein n=1 Tax=Pyxidicoccus trucidator TaxID=2709662 RepID=UPI0013D8F4E0|nr:pilus assembly protein N-terminal domain-containing protein [Pyxidicoccus trucidator]